MNEYGKIPNFGLAKREPDIGKQNREAEYAGQIEQGYTYRTNCFLGEVGKYQREYGSKGLEVFVGEKAFWENGTLDPKMRTILVRPKGKK